MFRKTCGFCTNCHNEYDKHVKEDGNTILKGILAHL